MAKIKLVVPDFVISESEVPDTVLNSVDLITGPRWREECEEELGSGMLDMDAIVFTSATDMTSELMRRSPSLKIALKAGSHPENIDYKYAAHNGIAVGWTPEANASTVAEFTTLLILTKLRNLVEGIDVLSEGGWRSTALLGSDLRSRVVGLVGLGSIARYVANILRSFGATVIAYDPYQPSKAFNELKVGEVSFDDLIARSDVISIHCPLNDDTAGLFDRDIFRKMKDTAILVNCARGRIVNQSDLVDAILARDIAGAAIDVYETEPLPISDAIRNVENLILTPHVAAFSRESAVRECVWAIEGCVSYLAGEINNRVVIKHPLSI